MIKKPLAAAVGAALTATCLTVSSVAMADGPRRIDVASVFDTSNFLGAGAQFMADEINVASDGKISFRVYEPGDLVPPFEVFNAVSSGAVDAGWDWMGYWAGTIPLLNLYGALPFGPTPEAFASWMWSGGGTEYIQAQYDNYNIKVLPCFVSPQETGGFYNKEINSVDDFDGLRFRISGLGARVLNKFGASTQLIPGGEIFLALERGRIDGAEFSVPQVDEVMGFDEITSYYYFPGWHQSASWFSLIINQNVWNQYSETQQKQFETACRSTLAWSMTEAPHQQMLTLAKMQERSGIDVRRFDDETLKNLEAAWEEVVEDEMNENPEFREAYESLMAHAKLIEEWYELQELP
ncbi:TRAP-type mannitol/chloroaromatic compound transport system, substrate-binding protein [Marinospirillum celere]|uniref:TRAP-type mannitol/chloroaromatic compound transport system, substrate-binding protein n=1 Tax=Marinospirillum celere TaxID=1122252 RepID=A0A1I1JQI8_9GAMM|nr:TRAP transporter substrate-binding protein [Marinospirillum celere]SFC48798.1 TRAP-type mannitol/chloroaromatic compound transport system, substrate-binding protein [Marinospirillum celere]